jgi:hypothetical protein
MLGRGLARRDAVFEQLSSVIRLEKKKKGKCVAYTPVARDDTPDVDIPALVLGCRQGSWDRRSGGKKTREMPKD